MAKQRILIIEDNRDNMTLIADVLLSLDYDILQATDGEHGLKLAQTEIPDLILMDLSLPRLDGWTVTQTIKQNPALSHIPIIAISAHAMMGDKQKAMQAGCNDYISKPINLQELANKLIAFLG